MELKFEVYAKIKKPISEVFDAVYNNQKLGQYFTTGGASAPMTEGSTVKWDFHDFPGAFPVYIKQVIKNEMISFEWESASEPGQNTLVEFFFEALDNTSTKVRVKESGWKENQKGLEASYGNCMGWSQMLCALKVFVEDGKNLREFMY